MTEEKSWLESWQGVTYKVSHGCPFDRGIADSWYSRPVNPHYWPADFPKDTIIEKRITAEHMTPEQIAEYKAGYAYNESLGGKKDWG